MTAPTERTDMTVLDLDQYLPAPVPALNHETGSPGLWLHKHTHVWGIAGTITHPNGSTAPIYRCAICGDRVYDYRQSLGGISPDTGAQYTTTPWWLVDPPQLEEVGLIDTPEAQP